MARYVYTYEEFVIVTEAPQSNRTQTKKNNIQIGNVQNGKNIIYNTDKYVWGLTCAWNEINSGHYVVNKRKTRFNVKCSRDGLLGGRNCFCVWSFWCSELCSVDQTGTVQRVSVLYVRDPEWFCQPFCSLWINTDNSPEVYDHLHCFEHVKLQVVKTAPDSQLLNLLSVDRLVIVLNEADQNFPSLTTRCLSVRKLVIHWQMEVCPGELCQFTF